MKEGEVLPILLTKGGYFDTIKSVVAHYNGNVPAIEEEKI